MTKKIIFLYLCIFYWHISFAQKIESVYQSSDKETSDIIYAVAKLSDGRLACAGTTRIPYQGPAGLLIIFRPDSSNSCIRKTFLNHQYYALAEDINGDILLAGQDNNGRPLLCRTDRRGDAGKELFIPTGFKLALRGIARLGSGRIIAASVDDNGNLELLRLQRDSLQRFPLKQGVNYCKDLISMQSDPNTGGIWMCGNTQGNGTMHDDRAWLLHLNQNGEKIDNNTRSLGPGKVRNTYVCGDSKLLLTGSKTELDGEAIWYAYKDIDKEGNSFAVLEDVYAIGIGRMRDSTILYVKSLHNDPDWLMNEKGNKIAICPQKLETVFLMPCHNGTVWIIGNLLKDKGLYAGKYTPKLKPVTANAQLSFGTPHLVDSDGDLRLNPGENAAVAFTIGNKGGGSSGMLVAWAEPLGEKNNVAVIHEFSNAVLLDPLNKETSTAVFLGLKAFQPSRCGQDSIRLTVRVSENGNPRLLDTFTVYLPTKPEGAILEITQPTTLGKTITKNATQDITIKVVSTGSDESLLKDQIAVLKNGVPLEDNNIINIKKEQKNKCYYQYEYTYTFSLSSTGTDDIIFRLGKYQDSIKIVRQKPDLYVFALGMEGGGNGSPKLRCPLKDATDFAAFAKKQADNGTYGRIHTMIVKNSNRNAILDSLNTLVGTATQFEEAGNENDYFIFYYSGHGAVEEGDFEILTESKNNSIKLVGDVGERYLNKLKLHKLVFIDACRVTQDNTIEPKQLQHAATFYACHYGAASKEPPLHSAIKNSYFTTAIFEAGGLIKLDDKTCKDCECCLAPDENFITVEELDLFLKLRVPRFEKKIAAPVMYKGKSVKLDLPVFYKIKANQQ